MGYISNINKIKYILNFNTWDTLKFIMNDNNIHIRIKNL